MKSIFSIVIVIAAGVTAPAWDSIAATRGAATIFVGDGVVEVAADSQCSLIEALENAVDQAQTHTDCDAGDALGTIVVLAEKSIYSLDAIHTGTTGLPPLTGEITVEGNGATIQRDEDGPFVRLLHVTDSGDVLLEDMALRNGSMADATEGGSGIFNQGTLALDRVTMTNNGGQGDGGAIFNDAGADLSISYSTLQDNLGGGAGGNIYNASDGTVFITHSTIGDGSCAGGGCALHNAGTATLVNSTVNSGGPSPGNINNIGTLTLTHVTIAGGGGFPAFSLLNNGTATLRNSMIAGNMGGAPGPIACDGFPLIFEGINLIEDGSCACEAETACLTGDPTIGLLADNGGPTDTHALLEGSIAIDAADGKVCAEDDQRGVPRPQFEGCDIGAFEVEEPPMPAAAFEPEGLDLGEVPLGNTSLPQSATLRNTGNVDLTGIEFTPPGAEFPVDTSDCGDSLGVDESCQISVSFSPSELGAASALLSVDSAETASADLNLSGTGIELVDPLFSDRFEQ